MTIIVITLLHALSILLLPSHFLITPIWLRLIAPLLCPCTVCLRSRELNVLSPDTSKHCFFPSARHDKDAFSLRGALSPLRTFQYPSLCPRVLILLLSLLRCIFTQKSYHFSMYHYLAYFVYCPLSPALSDTG